MTHSTRTTITPRTTQPVVDIAALPEACGTNDAGSRRLDPKAVLAPAEPPGTLHARLSTNFQTRPYIPVTASKSGTCRHGWRRPQMIDLGFGINHSIPSRIRASDAMAEPRHYYSLFRFG